ncbi:GTPase-activating protein [Microbotryomycetes sp. JL221]|nr:GTPase-activating protein [Microbotryomycetes sp. JL221]
MLRRVPTAARPLCTCSVNRSSATATIKKWSDHASTSAVKVEDLDRSSFSAFLPRQYRRSTLRRSADATTGSDDQSASGALKITKTRSSRSRQRALAKLIELSGTAQTSSPASKLGSTRRAHNTDEQQPSPYLPLVTRERSHLLSALRTQLQAAKSRSSNAVPGITQAGHPDLVWSALAAVLQYPSVVPDMPRSQHPLSVRAPITLSPASSPAVVSDLAQGHEHDHSGEEEQSDLNDQRAPLSLTLTELYQSFDVFARSRPRTKVGLQRLIVVAELIALKKAKGKPLGSSVRLGGRSSTSELDENNGFISVGTTDLRGEGLGLRGKDWKALLEFVASTYRAPRKEIETEGAFALYAQWSNNLSGRPSGSGPRRSKQHITDMHNALLHAAIRSRSWGLFDDVLRKMEESQVREDVVTVGLRLRKEHECGAHIQNVWALFMSGVTTFGSSNRKAGHDLWGIMLWAFAERGMLEQAMTMYRARRDQAVVNLNDLVPAHDFERDVVSSSGPADASVKAPPLDYASYAGVIQAASHQGDLACALEVLRDLVTDGQGRATNTASGPLRETPQIYASLFKGFAKHGERLDEHQFVPRSATRVNRVQASTGSLSALTKLVSGSKTHTTTFGFVPWSLKNLDKLFASFVALTPPRSHEIKHFGGSRSAPSSKELWWLILAYENMTDNDSLVVLARWRDVETAFAKQTTGWTGWRVDKRLASKIEQHRQAVIENAED